jgi:hypothetical protein
MVVKKQKKPWNLNSVITSLIRKAWKNSPMRLLALQKVLVNPEAKAYNRKYRCAACGESFLGQQVEVNHKADGFKAETWDQFIYRLFCGVEVVTYNSDNEPEGDLSNIVGEHLQVLCKSCHALETKAQKKRAKEENKKGAK